MKNMKKIFTLGLIAATTLTMFAACGSKSDDKTLTMATSADFPPYEYMDGDEFAGIDIDIANAIADKLGMELKIENVDFDSVVPGVSTGKYDIGMSGITITEDRKESVNFSDPYETAIQSVIVMEDSAITDVKDITADTKIGVQQGTTGDLSASEEFGDAAVTRYKVATDAVQALVTGKVDCVIIDNAPAQEYVKANEGTKLLPTEYVKEEYAIALGKKNTELTEKVNKALAELKEDGTIDKIFEDHKDSASAE